MNPGELNNQTRFAYLLSAASDNVIESFPLSSWLTIGDLRYGSDANFLKRSGAGRVVVSDLSDTRLKIAKDFGFVDEISAENVEKLSFDDNEIEIDFVLCKESFHHFPRSFMGLHEMLNLRKEYC
jgi:hypothetical protein